MGIFWGRNKANDDTPTPELAPAGATWGPWATHEARCKCSVCR